MSIMPKTTKLYIVKVYASGWSEAQQLHIVDCYAYEPGVVLDKISETLDHLISTVLSDGMAVKDIVIQARP